MGGSILQVTKINENILLLLFVIVLIVYYSFLKNKINSPKNVIKKYTVGYAQPPRAASYINRPLDQHPHYPLYDIRETLAPSRRIYMTYPYYVDLYNNW